MDGFWPAVIEFVKTHHNYILQIAFLICMAESIIGISLFVPSTLILLSFSATLTLSGVNIYLLWFVAGLGASLGDWISYALGYYFEDRLKDRWPLKNYQDLVQQGHEFFERWGWLSLFATRFIGPLRSLTPLIAGICAMPLIPFALASFVSALLWAGVVLFPGSLGISWLASQENIMTPLTLLLLVKIIVTFFVVAMPFLFFSKEKIGRHMEIEAVSPTLFRLYGIAILALLAGYSGGIYLINQSVFPIAIIAMGLVSNAGATFILILTGAANKQRFLTFFFAVITFGLGLAAIYPKVAISPLF